VKPSKFDEAEKLKQSNNRKCMKSYERLKSILAEKEMKGLKTFKSGGPTNDRRKINLWEKSISRQNSKSEKEFKENFDPKCKIGCADHESISLKRKLACNNATSNAKKPKNCENSINDEKLIYAEKSTVKKKPNKVDKAANLKQSNDAEKSTSGQKSTTIKEKSTNIDKAANFKQSNKDETSTSGQKSIEELMSEVVESSGKFFCPENCGKSFGIKGHLRKHLLSHRPKHEWPYVCLFCGQHCQARADLPKHFRSSKHINDSRIPKQGTPAWDDLMAKSVNTI
jgi:hypothetical protein